jgi:hypothetical protein
MPSASAKAIRQQKRAQLPKNQERALTKELVAIDKLEAELAIRRQHAAAMRNEMNGKQAAESTNLSRNVTRNITKAQASGAAGEASPTAARPTGQHGQPQNDSADSAGRTRNTSQRLSRARKTIGQAENGGTQNATQTSETTQRSVPQTEAHTATKAKQPQQRKQPQNHTQTYSKAYSELLQMLSLDEPPEDPTARKLFQEQLSQKVKRIMKSQKQRQTRRKKSKYFDRLRKQEERNHRIMSNRDK